MNTERRDTVWDNISDAVIAFGDLYPDRPALVDGALTLTYRQFATLVRQASVYLHDLGITADQRVGVALTNSVDHLILYFGLMRLGAMPVEIPAAAPADSVAKVVAKYHLAALFMEADGASAGAALEVRVDLHWRRLLAGKSGDARTDRDSDHCFVAVLTSGSTGIPRGIVSTHRQRIGRAITYQRLYGDHWSPEKPATFLLAMAISNSGYNQFMLNQILMAGTLVVLPQYQNVNDFVRMIALHDNAACFVTPDMCRAFIARACEGEILFPNVRIMIGGGLPLFAEDKRLMLERVTPYFYESYGAAGFGMISGLRPDDVMDRSATVGLKDAGSVIEVVDAHDQPLPPGAVGHLRCGGVTVASGWLADEDARTDGGERFHDGFYYPGDIAAIDEHGYITLKGRRADLIRRDGREIYPPEIEEAIAAHPLVKEVVVVGRPQAYSPQVQHPQAQHSPAGTRDEDIIAYVVLHADLAHQALAAHCAGRLPPGHLPQEIYYTAAIPRTANGKIDRPSVRAFALGQNRV